MKRTVRELLSVRLATEAADRHRGSILITVLVLGTILISAYFFFATRQLSNATAQAETMEYQNQKAYLESYVEYLMKHPKLMTGERFDNVITVDYLTDQPVEITGTLDLGDSVAYLIEGLDKMIEVEWNRCDNNYKADILIVDGGTEKRESHVGGPSCSSSTDGYDDKVNPVIISGSSVTLNAVNAPLFYRIAPVKTTDTRLTDHKWYLKAHIKTERNGDIYIEKIFTSP